MDKKLLLIGLRRQYNYLCVLVRNHKNTKLYNPRRYDKLEEIKKEILLLEEEEDEKDGRATAEIT